MRGGITQSNWFKYIFETLTLALMVGLLVGVSLGFIRDWKYVSNGFLLKPFHTISLSINEATVTALLFFLLFLVGFLIIHRTIKNTKWTCFIATAIASFPFFLYWGYKMGRAKGIGWSEFFGLEALIFNLKVGLCFGILWLLISIGLYLWTKSRILKAETLNITLPASLLGVVLIFNISLNPLNSLYTAKQDSPNVIIILVDALRADHLSCYGYSRRTTPNIDQFAKDSVIFRQAISQSTFTKTAIASLFTSLYPYEHGVYSGNLADQEGNITSDVLSEEDMTLAEALLQDEFLTMAWVQNGHLKSSTGFSQGFIEYYASAGMIERINERFTEWIREFGNKKKFFAYIHYIDLHDPYRPKPPYDTMYGVYAEDLYSGIDFNNWFYYLHEINEKRRKFDKDDVDQLIAYYDGQLNYIDSQIGLVLEELKEGGLFDKSLIILTSDHGDGFMEHGFISHSFTPYDELIRVPLIIKFPNSLYSGKVVKKQVQLIDVMPTILDFSGIEIDSRLSGFSLLNYLDPDKSNFPQYAFSEFEGTLSIRTEKYKYIHFLDDDKDSEFYDLSLDPKEQYNIINLKRNEAENFQSMALSLALEKEKREKDVGKVILDEETIDELKALGYIQ